MCHSEGPYNGRLSRPGQHMFRAAQNKRAKPEKKGKVWPRCRRISNVTKNPFSYFFFSQNMFDKDGSWGHCGFVCGSSVNFSIFQALRARGMLRYLGWYTTLFCCKLPNNPPAHYSSPGYGRKWNVGYFKNIYNALRFAGWGKRQQRFKHLPNDITSCQTHRKKEITKEKLKVKV